MTLTRDVEALRDRRAPIEMTGAEFRDAGHGLVDRIADWLEALPHGPVTRDESPADVRRAVKADRGLPESGTDARQLLGEAAELLFRHSLFNGHPRFFGYITSSPAPIGALADLLASAVNQNVGAWRLAPAATEIEKQTVRWIAELIGFPSEAGGLLVSGGNMANFVCFVAARTAKATTKVRSEGLRSLAGAASRLRLDRNAHLDPEGRRSVRPRDRRHSMGPHRRSAANGYLCARRSDRG